MNRGMTLTTMTMLVFMMALFGFASQVGAFPQRCTDPSIGGGDTSQGAVADCTTKKTGNIDPSCTPYWFQPATAKWYRQEPFWQDNTPYNSYDFVPNTKSQDLEGYQGYRSYDNGQWAEDVWVVHGHDKAGVQAADCGGDLHYFEWFRGRNTNTKGCKWAPYPAHDDGQCFFTHDGIDGEWFNDYMCGWWRGYDNSVSAALGGPNKENNGLFWYDAGVDPEPDPGQPALPSQWDSAKYALKNCQNCGPNDTPADGNYHTFIHAPQQPTAWFTGILWPWICNCTPNGDGGDFTMKPDCKCYCDNEPWEGRNPLTHGPKWGSISRVFNHNTWIVYCGKYPNDHGMFCDLIELTDCKNTKSADQGIPECQSSMITSRGFFVHETNFPCKQGIDCPP